MRQGNRFNKKIKTRSAAAFTEMRRDNAGPLANEYYMALDLPVTRYILKITQAGKAASQQMGSSMSKLEPKIWPL